MRDDGGDGKTPYPPLLVKRIGERFLRTLEFLLSKSTNSPFTLEIGGGRKGKDPAWRGIDSLISRLWIQRRDVGRGNNK